MRDDWLKFCLDLSETRAELYSGARKILRHQTLTLTDLANDLAIGDCGFTKSKLSMLRRNYLNQESLDAAVKLWDRRLEQDKYGSVGFTTYNHLIKGGGLGYGVSSKQTGIPPTPGGTMGGRRIKQPNHHKKCGCEMCLAWERQQSRVQAKNKRASVMGPCIQAVTLTLLKKSTAIDVFYRTTEVFKKFPADLVFLRDELLKPFQFMPRHPIESITFHFANVTVHPMYFVTIIPLLAERSRPFDVGSYLSTIRRKDKYFHDWLVKWTARYVCSEHTRGIQKFAQALRVQRDAMTRIDKKTLATLQRYLRDNHPGHRNDYVEPDEEE